MKRGFLMAAAVAVAFSACNSDEELPIDSGPGPDIRADASSAFSCVPNESRGCAGPGRCIGFELCDADGKSFGACDCGSSGSGGSASAGSAGSSSGTGGASSGDNGGSSGSAGSSGSGGLSSDAGTNSDAGPEPLFPGAVGLPCASSAACPGAPMVCILETSNTEFVFGGPQDGYCSLPCTVNADCAAIDGDSACNTDLGFCLALCGPGNSTLKCGAGRAQYCVPIADDGTVGACLPGCTSDTACGAGRFCDPGFPGLCVDTAPTGGAVGAPCTLANEETDCASGICLEYADPLNPLATIGSFCSANCTAGVLNGCGFDDLSSGLRPAACFEPQFADGTVGDIGVCFQLCDTTGDCTQANVGWTCLPFPDPIGIAQVGRQGECVPPGLGNEAPTDAGPG